MRSRGIVSALIVTAVVVTSVWWGATSDASAACIATNVGDYLGDTADAALPRDVRSIVFVGTVDSTAQDGHLAEVTVEEIWKGSVPAHLQVRGGETGVEDSRVFQAGTRYLFTAYDYGQQTGHRGGRYEDNGCSATQVYAPSLDGLRPATAHAPATIETSASSSSGTWWRAAVLACLAALALATTGAAVIRRRSP
jgi:hypothetical protein